MKILACKCALFAFLSAALLGAAGCSSQKPAEPATSPSASEQTPAQTTDSSSAPQQKPAETTGAPNAQRTTFAFQPGVAGGVLRDTFTASATVTAIDAPTRQVTFRNSNGADATITAGPEVRNFDQLKVGDIVTVTIAEQILIYVQNSAGPPTVTHAAALAAAPLGAKPGVLIGRGFELTATIKAIDAVNRTADLLFADGSIRTFSVRPDVDLTQYKAGQTVVIQVTQTLGIIAAAP
jgi:hypothetical protein